MKPAQRIDTLAIFVNATQFLIGRRFRILYDEDKDQMTVEFEAINEKDLERFRGRLDNNFMTHVKIKAITLVKNPPNRTTERTKKDTTGQQVTRSTGPVTGPPTKKR